MDLRRRYRLRFKLPRVLLVIDCLLCFHLYSAFSFLVLKFGYVIYFNPFSMYARTPAERRFLNLLVHECTQLNFADVLLFGGCQPRSEVKADVLQGELLRNPAWIPKWRADQDRRKYSAVFGWLTI